MENNLIINFNRLLLNHNDNLNIWENKFTENFSNFICQICLSFVINPVSCEICESIFCKKCLLEYSKTKSICPNRCKLNIRPVNRILKNLINDAKINCIFKLKGCNERINFEFFQSHLDLCEFGPFQCLFCDFVDSKSRIIIHSKLCENENKILNQIYKSFCIFCKKDFDLNLIQFHSFICEEQIIICKYCHKKMSIREYKNHEGMNCLIDRYEYKISYLQDINSFNENLISVLKNEISNLEKNKNISENHNKDIHKIIYNIKNHHNFSFSKFSANFKIQKNIQNQNENNSYVSFINKVNHDLLIIGKYKNIYFQNIKSNDNLINPNSNSIYNSFSLNPNLLEKENISYFYNLLIEETNSIIIGTNLGKILFYKINLKNNQNFDLERESKIFTQSITFISHYNIKNKNRNFILISGLYTNLKIFDFFTMNKISELDHRKKSILSFLYLPVEDYNYLLTTSKDSNIKLWSHDSEDKINFKDNLKGHNDFIWSLVKINENFIASGSGDKIIKIWRINNNFEIVLNISGNSDSITELKSILIFNKNFIISGSFDGIIKMWKIDLNNFKYDLVISIIGHKEKINSILIYGVSEEEIEYYKNNENNEREINLDIILISNSEDNKIVESDIILTGI